MPKTPAEVTEKIIKLLYDEDAPKWSVQDKGVLVAAVKLQLERRQGRDRD